MKKSTILTFATAAAVLATSAGTFAAWDVMDATATGTVTLRNPAVVSTEDLTTFASENESTYGADPVYKSTATFNITGVPTTGYELKVTPVVKDGNGDIATNLVKVDATVQGSADITDNNAKTVDVQVTALKDGESSLAGKNLTVEVKGEIVKKANQ